MNAAAEERRAFDGIKRELIDRTGHHYYADKDSQLADRIRRRMADTGRAGLATYRALLDGPGGEAEWRLLESAVTINETFFFRFADQFEALRTVILPELIAARAATRRLRIWSAGCSTGAEAYSIAVVVHDLLGQRLPEWSISILGTDIDEAALEAARAGCYGAWALRAIVDDATRDRLFVREEQHWIIRPGFRALARFERHNLLSLLGGEAALQLSGYDLILCRNVLIYFSEAKARSVAGALGDRLAPDGWLLLGHADPQPAGDAVSPVQVARVIGWRRDMPAPGAGPVSPAPPPPRHRPRRRAVAPVPDGGLASVRQPSRAEAEPVTALREALAAGLLDDAATLGGRAIRASPRDPVPHLLSAQAFAGLGRDDAAQAAFNRALYLDGGFAMAHYLAAVHHEEQGRHAAAARGYAAALRSLAGRPGDEAVSEGEGLTVSDLARSLRWRLSAEDAA